jgi:2-oxo-4-hydroxy-4-carboxy-5-ureidoimidazoline decarboxylase
MTQTDAPPGKRPLSAINQMTSTEFGALFAGVFEHTPWIAAKASLERPFPSRGALLGSMAKALAAAPDEDQTAVLQAHPMLGGQAAKRGEITEASRAEQSGLGLDRMGGDEESAFAAMNLAYQKRFGFPFIIAVRGQRDRAAILAALTRRFEATPETERQTALAEVVKIAGFRLDALIEEDADRLSLSLHVLDTARGQPGAGLGVSLCRIDEAGGRITLAEGETDRAGRWVLDAAGSPEAGIHELLFAAGAYQARFGTPGFYDVIAIRFRLLENGGHYHIPLILSPFGYSTYRGG